MICEICGGDGWIDAEETIVCQVCYGTGELQSPRGRPKAIEAIALRVKSILDKREDGPATNVFWSYKIWEATDLTEFMALSEGNKDSYRGLVRMGTVSLVDGSHSKTTLWSLFGEGTTTRANLEALIG